MITDFFLEGTNYRNVYDILGNFWTSIFEDKNFIDGVLQSNTFILNQADSNISKVNISLNEKECPSFLLENTFKISISKEDIIQKVCEIGEDSILNTTVWSVGQYANTPHYIIKLPKKLYKCSSISNTALFDDIVLLEGIDYTQKDPNTLIFRKHPSDLGFSSEASLDDNNKLTKKYHFYIKGSDSLFGYGERFARVPNAEAKNDIAYDILTSEVTNKVLFSSIQKALGITPFSVDGYVTRQWKEGNCWCLYNGSIASVPEELTVNLALGDNVAQGDILIKDMVFYRDVTNTPDISYVFVSPSNMPGLDTGISIPNFNVAVTIDNGKYIYQEDGSLTITESGNPLITESTKRNINLSIQGSEKDLNFFYKNLKDNLSKYDITMQDILSKAGSNNPVKILFNTIGNEAIPALVLTSDINKHLTKLTTTLSSIHNMSLPTNLIVGYNTALTDTVKPKLADEVNAFIVYIENEKIDSTLIEERMGTFI